MLDFVINRYLTLKLERDHTVIYINGKRFNQCKYLLIINPYEKEKTTDITSIDDAEDLLVSDLEKSIKPIDLGITPEEEFRAHCSNLQVWVENKYDTRLLHSYLSFPLLKVLSHLGDIMAKKVFKEEIYKRFLQNNLSVISFLLSEGYMDILNKEQREGLLLENNELLKDELIKSLERKPFNFLGINILEHLIKNYDDNVALKVLSCCNL